MSTNEQTSDSLPDDLLSSYGADEYQIPNNDKRKLAGYLYLLTGFISIVLFALFNESALINKGFLISGIGICLFGAYNLSAATKCKIDESDVLQIAEKELGFKVGPCSAQLMWRGLRSRPVWRMLGYSSEPIPKQRAVLLIDANTAEVLEVVVEENPEDWDASAKQTA